MDEWIHYDMIGLGISALERESWGSVYCREDGRISPWMVWTCMEETCRGLGKESGSDGE